MDVSPCHPPRSRLEPVVLEQRTGRIERIGSQAERDQSPVVVYEPYLAGTHDEKMFRVVKDRAQWFDIVMVATQVAQTSTPPTLRSIASRSTPTFVMHSPWISEAQKARQDDRYEPWWQQDALMISGDGSAHCPRWAQHGSKSPLCSGGCVGPNVADDSTALTKLREAVSNVGGDPSWVTDRPEKAVLVIGNSKSDSTKSLFSRSAACGFCDLLTNAADKILSCRSRRLPIRSSRRPDRMGNRRIPL